MLIFSGFFVGLLGGLHCIGMCGPIALALPVGSPVFWDLLKARLLYNLGRVLSYAFLGVLVGLLGRGLALGLSQQSLSLLIGGGILLGWLLPGVWKKLPAPPVWVNAPLQELKKLMAKQLRQHHGSSMFVIGILNGFLPCGLVYLALAGAIATGSWWGGAAYMALFGIGTIPMMLLASFGGSLVPLSWRKQVYRKALPSFMLVFGLWLIVRGMNLGIPYLSPRLVQHENHQTMECCERSEGITITETE
ncbi:sulfite exporter TauE/SafE family protein [Eisenibacter elegans]|jgi:sulfite exporter TauE/SafE|uniref:sulfite exporter TauE/SafE family protein n=1 Tax=Eisenibacter elegans TaxID=997 RepID=UPI000418E5DB|nr:sulfite exporter TauE/SafE family protein [Eisenibacter elegans]